MNDIVNDNYQQVTVITSTSGNFQCRVISPTGTVITDMGNGVFDTSYIASNPTQSTPDEDEVLYGQGSGAMTNAQYLDAIAAYKSLISEHDQSSHLSSAVYDLYTCHEFLDTLSSQGDRNILYGSLKTYLEDRIGTDAYSKEFNTAAYEVILMCELNMADYDAAVTGYQFLSLYHPSPETRLMSSEDLAIVEDLFEGEGGSITTGATTLQRIQKKIEGLMLEDPLMSRVKASFDDIREERKIKSETSLRNKFDKELADRKLTELKVSEERFDARVRENLSIMKNLTKEEKDKRNMETILMLGSITGLSGDPVIESISPGSYELAQNYPNPFNPITTISYSLPKDGLVKLRVFDITGREIATLVNESKVAGSYQVNFNGSNLSSGVYFYKIDVGSFSEVKRMVLVK